MRVRVASLLDAADRAKDWADRVISFVDASTGELPNFGVWHQTIKCEDTQIPTDMWAPQYDDIRLALDFCPTYSNVVVHCMAGISRSTALSIGLLVKDGLSIPEAVAAIHQQSPNMSPNSLILQHCERALQLDGLLVKQVQTLVAQLPKEFYLWCADCQHFFLDSEQHPCPSWQHDPLGENKGSI